MFKSPEIGLYPVYPSGVVYYCVVFTLLFNVYGNPARDVGERQKLLAHQWLYSWESQHEFVDVSENEQPQNGG